VKLLVALALLAAATQAAMPAHPDFSGRWVLHTPALANPDTPRRLVVLQPIVRTTVFGDLLPLVLPSDSVLVRAKTTLPVDAKRDRGRVGLLDTPEAVAPTLSVGRQSATIGATAIPDELRISMAGLLLPQPRTYSGCIGN